MGSNSAGELFEVLSSRTHLLEQNSEMFLIGCLTYFELSLCIPVPDAARQIQQGCDGAGGELEQPHPG